MTATGPGSVWVSLHHRDAVEIRAARAARLVAEVCVRVRCGGKLHTVRLQAGRLHLDGHPPAERRATSRTTRTTRPVGPRSVCRAAWRSWAPGGPRAGHGYWVRSARKPDRYKITDQTLPPPLRRARVDTITSGRRRADLRGWLGVPALAADVAGARLAARAIRVEYALLARPRLLLAPPRIPVTVVPAAAGGRVTGTVNPDLDEDGVDRAGLSAQIRHDWLRTVWWAGLGVLDGRTVLDVDHDDEGWPRAWVIDWSAPHWSLARPRPTTPVPGELGALPVPLGRDRAGRWHLVDTDAGTTIRRTTSDTPA